MIARTDRPKVTDSDSVYSSISLLLLEDQATQREILSAKFRKLGVGNVVAIEDGYTALNELSDGERPYDIVVVDLIMVEMDGLKFLHLAEEQCDQLPAIIVVSAVDDLLLATIRLAAKERGYNLLGAFAKPVSVADLMSALALFSHQQGETVNTDGMEFEEQLPAGDVKEALRNGDLSAYFQPIVSTSAGQEVVAVEALARWQHPVQGEVYPGGFIPMLEHCGLMAEFSELIIRQSVEQLRTFRDNGLNISISINITSLELERFEWVEELFDLVDEYRVPPGKITLEITEAMALSSKTHVTETLARLRLRGFGLSIDDFGVGYLSLSNFQRVAFTEIKIDRCLTEGLLEDISLQKIVASIIRLGHDLGLKVVAEAIEDDDVLRQLKLLGCDMIQGLAYSPAMSADDITTWCLERARNSA